MFASCTKHYPLDRLVTRATAEREMCNAIDEVCRKTKAPVENYEKSFVKYMKLRGKLGCFVRTPSTIQVLFTTAYECCECT